MVRPQSEQTVREKALLQGVVSLGDGLTCIRSPGVVPPHSGQINCRSGDASLIVRSEIARVSRLTTQAQRPGLRDATIANHGVMPGSLQRMVRPQHRHLTILSTGWSLLS